MSNALDILRSLPVEGVEPPCGRDGSRSFVTVDDVCCLETNDGFLDADVEVSRPIFPCFGWLLIVVCTASPASFREEEGGESTG